jgi:hypothetical protein
MAETPDDPNVTQCGLRSGRSRRYIQPLEIICKYMATLANSVGPPLEYPSRVLGSLTPFQELWIECDGRAG